MVELHMQRINFNRKRSSANKESTKSVQHEEELEEDSNSSESEEDQDERMNSMPIAIEDTCMKGSAADENSHPSLNLFKVSIDNDNALRRLHFELLKKLKNNDNSIECMINHIILHEGNSKSANKKKIQQIKKIFNTNSDNKDNDHRKENFAHNILFMIDNSFKDEFLTMLLLRGIAQRVHPLYLQYIGMQCLKLLVLDCRSKR